MSPSSASGSAVTSSDSALASGANSPATTAILNTLYAPVAAEMQLIEQRLRTELSSKHPFVDELVRYGCLLGGKRLRPALLLLTGKALGGITPAHLTLATVVEMIHTATLVHDDVLDEAKVRRHLATVNARWDNESSVLLGDYLFTHAFHLASTLDTVVGCRVIGRATNIVCEGELLQKGSRGNFRLTQAEYFEIIEGKTAELTACSCYLGAHFSAASVEVCDQMDGFGRDLGIAFQIADDLLDVLGEEKATGKSLGTDLEKQKPTLPLIYTLEKASSHDRQELVEILSSESREMKQILPFIIKYGGIEFAREQAIRYARRAAGRLEYLPNGNCRDTLQTMAEFVVSRSS